MTAAIKLYHGSGARSLRVLWALEELGLPYELVMVKSPARARFENYLELNPLGTVPVLFVDGRRMTESVAILHFLATRFGPSALAVAVDEPAYPDYLNFLVMGEATLTFPQTIYLRYTKLEPPERRATQAAEDYATWFRSRLRAAETMLGPEYACAERFTMADISVGYALRLANAIGLAEMVSERMRDYWARLEQRAGFQRALAAQQAPAVERDPG